MCIRDSCAAVPSMVESLDILVNNACQTVRRPPQYYEPLLRRELDLRNALAGGEATKLLTSEAAGHARAFAAPASAVALRDVDRGDPARRSQLCVLPGDERRDDAPRHGADGAVSYGTATRGTVR